jgi:hypothetical protein
MYRNAHRRNTVRAHQFTAVAVEPETAVEHQFMPFEGIAVYEGIPTGDGRFIEPNALRWEDVLPVPLQYSPTGGGHDDVLDVGWVDEFTRTGNEIRMKGRYDLTTEVGREAARLADQMDGTEGLTPHVSIVMDEMSFAIKVRAEVLEAMNEELQALMDGEVPPEPKPDENGYVTVYEQNDGDEIMSVSDAQIRAVTQVSTAAFKDAKVKITGEPYSETEALVASAAPLKPPAAWFEDPNLTGPTKVRYTEDGRIFGHLAAWSSCHIGYDECTAPPMSATDYMYFRTGTLLTKEGTEVPVGVITMGTTHANPRWSAAAAQAHYENTGSVVADINIGHDNYGIWVAGALRPGVTEEQKRALRAAPLSGDWRMLQGTRELIGALAVNTPGFPIPETQGYVANGEPMTLVASGIVTEERDAAPKIEVHPEVIFGEDWKYIAEFVNAKKKEDLERQTDALLAEIMGG